MTHLVYKLQPHEYKRYRKHLLALDDVSRYTRFAYSINDEMINRLCDGIEANPSLHKIFVIENEALDVVGVGHIALEGDTELAFSVLREYQNTGLGSSLMARCIEWLQNRSIKNTHMTCLATNTAIRKLASKHGVLVNDHGEVLADITIPEASPASVIHEVMDSNLARFDHYTKVQRNIAKNFTFPLLFRQ